MTPTASTRFSRRCFPRTDDCYMQSSSDAEVVSRRRILSQGSDDWIDEDVWFNKDRLFQDHIDEIKNKWQSIEDEIWAKVIVMERNRRVAKAYVRAPIIAVDGSVEGFDGYRIGLGGFDNPLRDAKTCLLKKQIGHGIKMKMDSAGSIIVKRMGKSPVYVKGITPVKTSEKNLLDIQKPYKLFDMKKFSSNVKDELKCTFPDKRKLESECVSTVTFVSDSTELLECSCWIMVINLVALDMLISRFPSDTAPPAKSEVVPPPKMPLQIPLPDYDQWYTDSEKVRAVQHIGYRDRCKSLAEPKIVYVGRWE